MESPTTSAVTTSTPSGSTGASTRIDLGPQLKELQASAGLPGIGAVVFDLKRGIYGLGVSGVRATGRSTKAKSTDPWHLGSCTKAMTSTLVARCVEAGHVQWDTTLGDVFKDLQLHKDWESVTLVDLLTHRSGAAPNAMQQMLYTKSDPRKARTLLLRTLTTPAPHDYGSYLYSNTGYTLVGCVLERVLDVDFELLLRRELFSKLHMTSAGFGPPGVHPAGPEPDAPYGHSPGMFAWAFGRKWKSIPPSSSADNPCAIAPAGTVHANLEDWASFLLAHLAGAAGDESFLTSASWERLHTPVDDYALGWLVTQRNWAGGKTLTHGGSNTFWKCVTWLAPEKGWGLAVTVNAAGKVATETSDKVASMIIKSYPPS